MHALLVIDAQNEFSDSGKRPVPNFSSAIKAIGERVDQARKSNFPIAWIRHFNRPSQSKAFVPNTWGSEFAEGLRPNLDSNLESEFHKDVYGAFTGTDVGRWLESLHVNTVLIVGFYTHACVSTTSREALMRDYEVFVDFNATGACDIKHELLGNLSAEEVRISALLQLENIGVNIIVKDKERISSDQNKVHPTVV